MTEFEWIFHVHPMTLEHEEALESELDAFIGGHGHTTLVTASIDADDPLTAGKALATEIQRLGVEVTRAYPDLVTRKTIATRAAVTPQAVGLWIRGERQGRLPFPEPFTLSGGGLWLWADVHSWLRHSGQSVEEMEYPHTADLDQLNAWLLSGKLQYKRLVGPDLVWAMDYDLETVVSGKYQKVQPPVRADFVKAV